MFLFPPVFVQLLKAFSVFSMNIVVLLHLFKPRAHPFKSASLNIYVGTQIAREDSSRGIPL